MASPGENPSHRPDRHVKYLSRLAWCILVWHPGTEVHVGDADPVDVRGSPGEAILDPLQEDPIKASGFIMGQSLGPRKTGPLGRPGRSTRYSPSAWRANRESSRLS